MFVNGIWSLKTPKNEVKAALYIANTTTEAKNIVINAVLLEGDFGSSSMPVNS